MTAGNYVAGWPESSVVVDDRYQLDAVARRMRYGTVIIDESGTAIDRYDDSLWWFATQSRHYDLNVYFLCQRITQLSPTVREQCERAVAFRCRKKDAVELSEGYNAPILERANELQRGEFYLVDRFDESMKGSITFGQNPKVTLNHV